MSRIDAQCANGETPDDFIALLLGVRARLRRGEARLLAEKQSDVVASGSSAAVDDGLVLAALGWIAVQRRFDAWLAECTGNTPLTDAPDAAALSPRSTGLLR